MVTVQWSLLHFDALSNNQLYDVLRLRSEVFVVEQNCVFRDLDNIDQHCHHLLGYAENQLVASTRLVPPGISYQDYASIGRVVTAKEFRRHKIGSELMNQSIAECRKLYTGFPIKIGAQLYLERFYASFGFTRAGEVYDEDGIDHIPMILL